MNDLGVTRIVNSCALLDFGGQMVLTDPWFTERWHLHRGEPLGCAADDVPALAAVIGSHVVPNHWEIRALAGRQRPSTPVITSNRAMTRRARRAGFDEVHQLAPGDVLDLDGGMRIQAVDGGAPFGMSNNSYLIEHEDVRVFFGGEARDLEPLARWVERAAPVDVALLPVNGLQVLGGLRLVMDAATAVEAATMLGASYLVPIHDAHARDALYTFVRRSSTAIDARAFARIRASDLEVVLLHTGVRWTMTRSQLTPSAA
jgi:L-ascorbate metabolism protein UlaG (beta-lactamase superfamily)